MLRSHRASLPAVFISTGVICLLALAGCSDRGGDPFSYVKVSGTVTYEDGAIIPAQAIFLNFIPQGQAVGNKVPRVAQARVDVKTGEFKDVTSHTANDGLAKGKYKVTINGSDHSILPAKIVPEKYGDFKQTTIEVDTDVLPIVIRIPKPGARK
jgi:hypothetical protein